MDRPQTADPATIGHVRAVLLAAGYVPRDAVRAYDIDETALLRSGWIVDWNGDWRKEV